MPRKYLFTAALLAGVSLPAMASATEQAFTTANLNVRIGPDASYARIATIPEGHQLTVFGCVSGYLWCDISWQGLRGWVYSEYLAFLRDNRRYDWRTYAPRYDFPIISFSFGDYHDRWYKDRPWYRHRHWDDRWSDRWDRRRGRWWDDDDHRRRGDWRGRDDDDDRRRGDWRDRDDDDRRDGWRGRRDDDDDRRRGNWRGRDDDDGRDGRRGRGDDDGRRHGRDGRRGGDDDRRGSNVRRHDNRNANQNRNWNTWGAGQNNSNQGGYDPPYR